MRIGLGRSSRNRHLRARHTRHHPKHRGVLLRRRRRRRGRRRNRRREKRRCSTGLCKTKVDVRSWKKALYLDCAITGAKPRDEGASTFVRGVHADARAGPGVAGLLDAAMDISWTRAVAREIEALRCAVGCVLACTCSILSYHTQSKYCYMESRYEGRMERLKKAEGS